ncbi:putative sulfate transporter [Paraburkholderia domus]|jgi:Sulfate permease and related transporters (MFS superfamily)|uniref:Sulfate transporter n=1 Tax=Paraburkholderia domus TaxID=2793075 RepID=A0A9N8QU30_9BURK|nr:SulP family inorganic anion transporter [Paraburkholderia domus]MBK5064956.1 SulP family inorganic anion transporter [Burkholderia sp. R-70199]MBK5091116.1 SulP family inorganic anion transporter [Burkholderia sp. R-69927]MBK5125079.1 SulP family inorganic anion transporter [Burkholderia sp. R-69980]MBK5168586.1 SulP family inorganic anion transporter [Burkholderia sp. R-70211]MBK5183894.1 SulP family inorganic anion transporter [Burkholderia sp. R-69749]MCI0152134.1 STAS domain-containing
MKPERSIRQRKLHGQPGRRTLRLSAGGVRIPFPDWLRDFKKEWARPDIVAGLTVSAVVIPKALAYATIAGLPVQVGLYTAFIPMLIYALLGTSCVLSVSTTTTIAILVATALNGVASANDAASLMTASATLTCLVGAILVVARLLRLGFVANFISEPVLIGFKAGVGIVIVVDQVPKLLGIHFHKGSFFHNLLAIAQGVPQASLVTAAVGVVMIGLLVSIERLLPRAPAPLIAVAAGIAAVSLFGLPAHGVATVGNVPTGLPAFTPPDPRMMMALWPPALGVALMSFTETIAAGRAFARSGEPTPQPNQELLATGLANLGGAFFGAMAAGGGTTQTAVNRLSGARSQLSGLVTSFAALGTMLLLAPLIGLMPEATLAAVVIVYSVGLIKPAEFREILSVRRTEFIWALVALIGVVLAGTLEGIVVAIIVSLVALAHQVSDPPVYVLGRKPGTNVFRAQSSEHPEDETFPGMLMLRPEGRIFFANAQRIGQKMRLQITAVKPKVVAIDLAGIFDFEFTALKMLTEAEKKLREEERVTVWLVGLNPGVLAMVRRSPLGETLGHDRMFFNMDHAVARYHSSETGG